MTGKIKVELSGADAAEITKHLREVAAEVEKMKIDTKTKHIDLTPPATHGIKPLWKISYET